MTQSAENDVGACVCGHSLRWHHETRGCGYRGFSPDGRCPCFMPFDVALEEVLSDAWDAGYLAAMDDAWKSEMAEPTPNPYRVTSPAKP